MNKKAQISDYMVFFIPRLIFLIIVVAAVSLLIHKFIQTEVDTFDAESSLFVQQLLYSKNALAKADNVTGQYYPGILDYSRIMQDDFEEQLEKALNYNTNHLAAKMTITDISKEELVSFYYKKSSYENWIVLSQLKGPGASRSLTKKLYVILDQDGSQFEGFLEISVVMPNE
jgi:hypothetical protein